MERFNVAIIIPAYNESSTIATVVKAAKTHGDVIVVDDSSSDDTAILAANAGAFVVIHSVNKGYDGALNSGFAEASRLNYDFIITLDADGQHDPMLIEKYVKILKSGIPLVLGVRHSTARFAESIFSFYTFLRYGINDPLCGMKGYHCNIFRTVGHFDSYGSIGTELMLRAVSMGYKFKQVPFKVRRRIDKPRFGRIFRANKLILRAMFKWFGINMPN